MVNHLDFTLIKLKSEVSFCYPTPIKVFFFIQYFRLLFTYPPLVAGRLPDGKRASTPKTPRDSKGFVARDPKITTGRVFDLVITINRKKTIEKENEEE